MAMNHFLHTISQHGWIGAQLLQLSQHRFTEAGTSSVAIVDQDVSISGEATGAELLDRLAALSDLLTAKLRRIHREALGLHDERKNPVTFPDKMVHATAVGGAAIWRFLGRWIDDCQKWTNATLEGQLVSRNELLKQCLELRLLRPIGWHAIGKLNV